MWERVKKDWETAYTFCINIFNPVNIKTFVTFYSANFIIIISFVNASSHSNEYEIDVNRMLCGRFVVSFKLDPFHCNPAAATTACLLFYSEGAMKKSILYNVHVPWHPGVRTQKYIFSHSLICLYTQWIEARSLTGDSINVSCQCVILYFFFLFQIPNRIQMNIEHDQII